MGKKVLIVGEYGSSQYHRPFKDFGEESSDSDLLWTNPRDVARLVFTGGADVTPALYGEESARGTSTVPRRDIYESITFQRAKMIGKPMVGICRGSQFLNVMAGGKLCQHLDNHGCWHDMETCDGQKFEVSSTHHQMMLPPPGAKVIGWSAKKRSTRYYGELDKPLLPAPEKEYEVIYWPNIRAIGMQYHPECMGDYSKGFLFAAQVVQEYLLR
jgi:gamma-glutamyl-gamma-aminobutyrate hydrolase PuuD